MAVKKSFRVIRGIIRLFTPKMKTVWDVPYDGEPAVFCPNHARAWGPIAMLVHFELWETNRTWYNWGISDRKGLPAYVRNDNWWNPNSKLAWLWNATVPYLVAWLLPPLVRTVPGIAVYYDERVFRTFTASVKELKDGNNITIFAQFPDGYQSHAEELSKGFLMIGPMAQRRLGRALKFWPVHIDEKEHTIHVMAPVVYDTERTLAEQEAELLKKLSEGIYD